MRESVRRSVAAVALLALVLGAFAPAAVAQSEGGTLIFGGNQEPAQLDAFAATTVDEQQVVGQIFEQLAYLDESLQPVPGLATAWESNAEATEYTFTIREGVKFHNGDPLDAAAVAAHWDRLLSDELPGSTMTRFKGSYTGSTVIDPSTVTLEFNSAQPALLLSLADPGGGITNAAAVAAQGADAGSNPIGSGPFKFVEWIQGSEIRLERNDDWTWGNADYFGTSGPANLEKLTFRYLPDAQTRTAAVEAGDVQMISLVPHQNLGALTENPDLKILDSKLPGLPQGNWLNTSKPPFDDLNVRRAVFYAVDRPTIATVTYFDLVEPTYAPITQGFPEYQGQLADMYPFDPEKSAALLDEAGWLMGDSGLREKDGERLFIRLLENRGWNEWNTVLQDQLRDVGFDAQIQVEEGGGYYAAAATQQFEMPSMGSVNVNPVDIVTFSTTPQQEAGTNGGVSDPVIDQMYADMQAELDPAVRSQMVIDWQIYMMEQAYYLPIFEFTFFSAMDKGLDGLVVDGGGFYIFFANASLS